MAYAGLCKRSRQGSGPLEGRLLAYGRRGDRRCETFAQNLRPDQGRNQERGGVDILYRPGRSDRVAYGGRRNGGGGGSPSPRGGKGPRRGRGVPPCLWGGARNVGTYPGNY